MQVFSQSSGSATLEVPTATPTLQSLLEQHGFTDITETKTPAGHSIPIEKRQKKQLVFKVNAGKVAVIDGQGRIHVALGRELPRRMAKFVSPGFFNIPQSATNPAKKMK